MPGSQQSSPTRSPSAAIRDALAQGATVLVQHQRGARSLRHEFDELSRLSGETVWAAPAIFALDSWLGTLWTQLLLAGSEERLLLNRSQEHQLWRAILSADPALSGLVSLDQLATLAAEAWRPLALYGGREQMPQHASSPDTEAFTRWAAEFEQTCIRRRYLTSAQLPSVLNSALGEGSLPLPDGGVVLLDFLDIAPAYEELFHSVELAGYPVVRLRSAVRDVCAKTCAAHDDAGEVRAAAEWLRSFHIADPASRLALVVADLDDRRSELDRALADCFGTNPFAPAAYEFAGGQSLSDTSAGACALTLLRWCLAPLPLEKISGLLLSPFFGATDPTTATAVAEFDVYELRRSRLLRPEMSLAGCARKLQQSGRSERVLPLLARMEAVAEQPLDPRVVDSPAHWADQFRTLLGLYGWSEAVETHPLSQSVHKAWESALDELATLSFDNAPISAITALDRLTRICSETIFAPESHNAPLQVLAPREVPGTAFDALWFLGTDDSNWPIPASAHPLLPWTLQHAMRMPGADPERDATATRALTRSLAASAAQVVFSYALNGEDCRRRLSAPVAELSLEPFELDLGEVEPALALESVDDSEPLPALPDAVHRGGARIFELQAACSFRAFAELRLNSTPPEDVEFGFDVRESGTLLHRVMQRFWETHLSQANLRALSPLEREQSLREAIAVTLEKAHARSDWDRAYVEVQRRRLFDLFTPWLEIEASRPDFTVLALEKKIEDVAIGPLRLDLRIDRVDQTAGGALIIDYKSGEGKRDKWEGSRPDKPQLPLYGVLTEGEELGGIAFAILRAGKKIRFEGLAANDEVLRLKPMPRSMPEQVGEWKEVLESLAYEFADGAALVSPKDHPHTCQYCGQRLLCRLNLTAQSGEDTGLEEEEEGVNG